MIELKWGEMRDPMLNAALQGLAQQRVPYKTTLKLLTIMKAIESEQKKAHAMAKILSEKYGVTDPETKSWSLRDEKDADEFEKSEKEFAETSFKIRSERLKVDELENTELTAIELSRLERFIDMPVAERAGSLKSVEAEA